MWIILTEYISEMIDTVGRGKSITCVSVKFSPVIAQGEECWITHKYQIVLYLYEQEIERGADRRSARFY